MQNTDKAWERYGAFNPYYGVLTEEKYSQENLSTEAKLEFFESGRDYVNSTLSKIHKHLDSDFQPDRVLDFGCGVGRILIPLAKVSTQAVGLDVSSSMLAEARKNSEIDKVKNIELIKSDDSLQCIAGRKFNFIHSYIVFQHIPTQRGEAIFSNLLEHLDDNGVGVVHFTYYRNAPKFSKLKTWVRYYIPLAHNFLSILKFLPFNHPLMQMNCYNLARLLSILDSQDVTKMYVETTNHGGFMGVIFYFQKTKS